MLDMLNRSNPSAEGPAPRKTWQMILVDSAIVGLFAAAAVMGNTIPGQTEIWVMVKAFVFAFAWQLINERGLKPAPSIPEEEPPADPTED